MQAGDDGRTDGERSRRESRGQRERMHSYAQHAVMHPQPTTRSQLLTYPVHGIPSLGLLDGEGTALAVGEFTQLVHATKCAAAAAISPPTQHQTVDNCLAVDNLPS